MANYTVDCDNCCYYNHEAMLCTNPDGPYGNDCRWEEEEEA